jgi:hypothetical protein
VPEPRTSRKAAAEEEEAPATSAAPVEVGIPVGRLIAESLSFLGCPSHVAAGALYGHDSDEEMTAEAAKSLIADWLQKPVGEG